MVIVMLHSFTGPPWVSSLWIGEVLQSWWSCESDAWEIWGRHRIDCPCGRERDCTIFRPYISRGMIVEYKVNAFYINSFLDGRWLFRIRLVVS